MSDIINRRGALGRLAGVGAGIILATALPSILEAAPVDPVDAAVPMAPSSRDPLYLEAWAAIDDELGALIAAHELGADWERSWVVLFRNVLDAREDAISAHGEAAAAPWADAIGDLFRVLKVGLDHVKASRIAGTA